MVINNLPWPSLSTQWSQYCPALCFQIFPPSPDPSSSNSFTHSQLSGVKFMILQFGGDILKFEKLTCLPFLLYLLKENSQSIAHALCV